MSPFSIKKLFHPLFLLQILAHLSIIPMLIWAKADDYLISLGVYFFTGCVGVSMTYHRFLAHSSWKAPRWFEIFGTLCASLGLIGSSLAWPAVHREHHQSADTPQDPHSPIYKPWWKIQFLSMFYTPKLRFMRHKLKDPFHKFMHKNYLLINALYALTLFVYDPLAVVYGYLFPSALLWNTANAVNTIGHLFGYRNFETKDESQNNFVLAYLTWGEGWHNNHHHKPKSFYFGTKWYELDIAGSLILFFSSFRRLFIKLK